VPDNTNGNGNNADNRRNTDKYIAGILELSVMATSLANPRLIYDFDNKKKYKI